MTEQTQSKVRFTPGPWVQNQDEQHYLPHEPIRVGNCDEGKFRVVCEMDHVCTDDDEAEANARLIAAAPDMLKALRMFLEWEKHNLNDPMKPAITDVIKAARAALAKVQP